MKLTFLSFLLIVVLTLTGAWAVHLYLEGRSQGSQIVSLQESLVSKDKTIEEQKGVYAKLAADSANISALLDKQDLQIKELQRQVSQSGEKLLAANSVTIGFQRKIDADAKAKQTDIKSSGKLADFIPIPAHKRERVDFSRDFGFVGVDGYTITDPAEAHLSLVPGKPLKVSLVISEQRDGSWKTYATSSDNDVSVDIGLSAVNRNVLAPPWYTNLGFRAELGGGYYGALVGLGVDYTIGQVELGPSAWTTVQSNGAHFFFGADVIWRPFERH